MRDELQQFLEACDPAAPAAGDPARGDRFVDRKDGFRVELAVRLRQEGARVLCVGQTGIGKTTELLRVADELQTEYAVVVPPVDRMLDLSLLGWHDIIAFSCLWAAAQSESSAQSGAVLRLAQVIGGEKRRPNPILAALSVAAKEAGGISPGRIPEPSPLQRFRNEHPAIKNRIARGPAQVADLCRQAVAEIEGAVGKQLIVLIDGVEKVSMKVATSLFYKEARLASELPFRAAVVGPHRILHEEFSADLGDFFSTEPLILRAISCQENEPEGRAFFREMLHARGGADLIEPDALEVAIDNSGGIPRQLLTIVSNAARLAVVEDVDRIPAELMLRGRARAMERFFYALRDDDYEALLAFSPDRPPGPHLSRLLRLLAVIEYGKQSSLLKLGINPLCAPLLQRYKKAHVGDGKTPHEVG